MNLARQSIHTFLFQSSGYGCALLSGMLLARALGPENRGLVAIALLTPSVFWIIFNPAIEAMLVYHIGQKKHALRVFAGNTLFLAFLFSSLALVGFFFTLPFCQDLFYKSIDRAYLYIAIAALPFYFLLYYFSCLLRGNMDINGYNITLQLPYYSSATFILLFLFLKKLEITTAIIAGISGFILGGVYSLIRSLGATRGISFDKSLNFTLIRDGSKLYIGFLANFLMTQINIFILNYYTNPSEVGFYSIAFTLSNILFFFCLSVEAGLYPKLMQSEMDDALRLIETASRQLLLITGAGALLMAVFSKHLVLVFAGEKFLPSVQPLLILLPGIVLGAVPRMLTFLFIRTGRFILLSSITLIVAIVSLIMNFILVPQFRGPGTALTVSFSYLLLLIVEVVIYKLYAKKDIRRLFVPQKTDFHIYREVARKLLKPGT